MDGCISDSIQCAWDRLKVLGDEEIQEMLNNPETHKAILNWRNQPDYNLNYVPQKLRQIFWDRYWNDEKLFNTSSVIESVKNLIYNISETNKIAIISKHNLSAPSLKSKRAWVHKHFPNVPLYFAEVGSLGHSLSGTKGGKITKVGLCQDRSNTFGDGTRLSSAEIIVEDSAVEMQEYMNYYKDNAEYIMVNYGHNQSFNPQYKMKRINAN